MSAKSDPHPALDTPTVVTSEYYYRRPLRAGEWLGGLAAGVAVGAAAFYVVRIALGRTAISSRPDEPAVGAGHRSRRSHLRRARNG